MTVVVKKDVHRTANGEKAPPDEPADFETAIAASAYGKYHYILLALAFPGYLACTSVVSTVSYVLSSAECDLNMTLVDKGILNAITYAGTLTTAILWGILSDTLGRRKLLIYGFLSLGIIEMIGSMSQSFWMILVCKYIGGAIMNGPYALQITYISEVHSTNIRAKILVFVGMFYTISDLSLPMIAWAIIPRDWDFSFFNGAIVIHSWNIYMALLSLPALIASFTWTMVPESPKFLMSRGRNEEALQVFQHIYSMNTGKSPDSYPIKVLVDEVAETGTKPKGLEALKGGFKQMMPLFHKQHLKWLLLLCLISAASNFGGNAMRLWFPQIATLIEDYSTEQPSSAALCDMLVPHTSNRTSANIATEHVLGGECVKLSTGFYTYFNSLVVNATRLITNTVGGMVINILGKRYLGALCYFVPVICVVILPWTSGKVIVVALFALIVSMSTTGSLALNCIAVDLFPTSLRAMAVAVYLMFGRVGTLSGNIAFPSLLEIGCLQPFLVIAGIMTVSALGCLLLPKTTLKRME